jgi:hypothetical protein
MASFSTITDNFNSGSFNPGVWSYSVGHVAIASGQVTITGTTSIGEFNLFTSAFYDLTSSQVSIQLVSAGNQAIQSWEVYPILLQDSTNQNKLFWYVFRNFVGCYKTVSGTQTQVYAASYDPAIYQWFRIREAAGITYWEYSTNGASWTVAHSETDPFSVTSLQFLVQAGPYAVETQTTTAVFDNVNQPVGPYRLWPATNGPATPISYTGNFLSGTVFTVTEGGCWFQGYWWWVCGSGQSTAPVKCALWDILNPVVAPGGVIMPGSVVTSGTLTAGQWNWIPLPTPVQLAIGDTFIAAVGCNGAFPDTNNYWGSGQPGGNGITNGPLTAFSAAGGTVLNVWSTAQGVFSVGGSDPSLVMPQNASNTDNFWVDVQISKTPPAGYQGSWRLWPNMPGATGVTAADSAVNYVVGTEIDILSTVTLDNIWFFSPSGTAQLPTEITIWSIGAGGLTGTSVIDVTSLTWSGAAGSGWISTPIPGSQTLSAGKYRVSVYNNATVPDGWSAKFLGYWGAYSGNGSAATMVAYGRGSIASGPLFAPASLAAQTTWSYNGGGASEPGQSVFAVGPPNSYPNQYVGVYSPGGALFQNYWVDLEVSPVITTVTGTATITIGPVNISSYGNVVIYGSASIVIGPVNISGGVQTVFGYSSITVGGVNIHVNGHAVIVGSANVTFGPLRLNAVGHAGIVGHASITVGPLRISYAPIVKIFTEARSLTESSAHGYLDAGKAISGQAVTATSSAALANMVANLLISPDTDTGTGVETEDMLIVQAALLNHFLDTYVVPDPKNWEVENERARHDQALYRLGEYGIFVLMWQMQDFTLGLVGRCKTCYVPQGAVEDTWKQAAYFKCPDCLGTSFEGGYKAILVRPSLWNWNEPVQQQDKRGVIDTDVAQVQTTGDFRLQPKDYIIRGDGSRWQAQNIEGEHLDTGFGTQAGAWNAISFNYANVTREDESSPIYLLPISENYIQTNIPQYYSRGPVNF